MMKRILITGITGYIGSCLASNLLASCEVYGLVRQPVRTEYISKMQDRLHLLVFDGSYASIEDAMKKV